MPIGSVSGSVDLPGGLGGELTGASLTILEALDQDQDDPEEIRLAIVAPDSEAVLASTRMTRIRLSSGQVGVRCVLQDQAKLFTVELLMAGDRGSDGTMQLSVDFDLAGRHPRELIDGLNVLANWHAPNRVALGRAYGPPDYGVLASVPQEAAAGRNNWGPICTALAQIQEHVVVQLRMPAQMEEEQALGILDAASLLSGQSTTGTVTGPMTVTHTTEVEIVRELNRLYDFKVIRCMEISLGEQTIPVGKQVMLFQGRYSEIGDNESTIMAVGEYVSLRYVGDLVPGAVHVRYAALEPVEG
jgi:hypothetical protein